MENFIKQNIPIIISVIAILISVLSFLYNRRYAGINLMYTTVKILTDKTKDCNSIWAKTVDGIDMEDESFFEEPKDFINVVNTIYLSMVLIFYLLQESKSSNKTDFYLRQFFIQLDPALLSYIDFSSERTAFNQQEEEFIKFIRREYRKVFATRGEKLTYKKNAFP